MLGGVDRAPLPTQGDAGAKEVAAGIAAELRSELASLNTAKPGGDTAEARIAGLESYLKNLEASLSAQLKAQQADPRPSVKFESVLEAIGDLTRPAQALLRGISRVHLTKSEYQHLSQGRLGPALVELRKVGLLVPVVHKTSHGPEPCYYFPPGISKIARAALHVLPEPAQEIQQDVTKELKAVGYPSGHGDDDRPVGANGTNTA
jgi:hypothetical protein